MANKNNTIERSVSGRLKTGIFTKLSVLLVFCVSAVSALFLLFDSFMYSLGGAVVVLLISIFVAFLITGALNPLKEFLSQQDNFRKQMVTFADSLEKASRTGRVKAGDDDSTRKIADTFNFLIKNVNSFIDELDKISEETLDVSRHLASSTENTSTAMENITHALEDFASVTDNLNNSSEEVTKNADRVNTIAQEGMQKIKDLENMMVNIRADSEKASLQINELNNATAQIENILQLISEIADSTNMLALNASIEAARAGEEGKGFTVVAGEIRKLAQDTQKSLKDINNLINNLKETTGRSVKAISENNSKIIKCEGVMKDTSNKFREITSDIGAMVESINMTTKVSRNISKGREEISAAAEEQISSVKEIDDTAKQLSLMAAKLKEKLADTNIGGMKLEIDLDEYDKMLSSITEEDRQKTVEELDLEGKFVVSVVARLEEVKGHEFLFRALKPVISRHNNVICLVIGDGSIEEKLKELVDSEGIAQNVKFLGFRKDIPLLLSISDLTVLTSRKEGMPPRILLEAMASSKPVIATDLNGTRHITKDGKTGFLVKYGEVDTLADRIVTLVNNSEKSRQFGSAARTLLEELVEE